ncbi:MAG: SCO family protein [Devosia sp.]
MLKSIRIALWGLVLVTVAVVSGVYVGQTFFSDGRSALGTNGLGAALARSQYEEAGGPFTLIGLDGQEVTRDDLKGKPLALFFGFTHCPDVCPTAMLEASNWLDALGEDADKLTVAFVSVDPARDTPELLKHYLGAFDTRIVGLTADDEATIAKVAERYKVRFEKVPLANGSYTMNHTADTLLFDADGNYVDFIAYLAPNIRANATVFEAENERTLEKLRTLIAS